jgi:hypothetical protein
MDVVVNCSRREITAAFARRRRHGSRYRAVLSLLAAFGVLAFVFSVISPDDDDIQQEFFQGSKSKQCVRASYKTISSLQTFRICAVYSALAQPTPQFAGYYVAALISVPSDEIKSRVCGSRIGERSPPYRSR